MSKRIYFLLLSLCMAAYFCTVAPRALAQQDDSKKQTLVIGYPTTGIVIKQAGAATDAKKYLGIIYVKVFPVSPDLVRRYGAGPMVSAELTASARTVNQLPLGQYEVRYGMRTGSELKTFIVRDVILRADRGTSLLVEMNDEAKTTIVGGDMTAQEMADTIRQLRQEIADLKREITTLKAK
ncbi:MAG: hypothetical protein V4671_21460 [Armatimonadota bacterium]